MELIKVNDEVWKEMESGFGLFSPIRLKIEDDVITIKEERCKNKIVLAIYINSWLKGNETEENQKRYWFEARIKHSKTDKEFFKDMAKLCKGEEKKKYKKLANETYRDSYFHPCFSSFRTLKSAYNKRHNEIYWIKESEVEDE